MENTYLLQPSDECRDLIFRRRRLSYSVKACLFFLQQILVKIIFSSVLITTLVFLMLSSVLVGGCPEYVSVLARPSENSQQDSVLQYTAP